MINIWLRTSLTVLLVVIGHLASAADRPNLIWIMADDLGYGDLGYGDLGCYGQKGSVALRSWLSEPWLLWFKEDRDTESCSDGGRGSLARQCQMKRTPFGNRGSTTIALQQFVGTPGQHSSHFSPFALHPWDWHRVVGGRLVPHPRNDGGFSPFLDRDAFRAGDGSTSHRCRVIGHNTSEAVSNLGVAGMKGKERQDRSREVFDVLRLNRFTSFGIGDFSLGKALCGSFGFEFGPNPFNRRRRCPHAP